MQLRLDDVRLSFFHGFEPDNFGRYSAAFLFLPAHPAAKAVRAAEVEVAKAKWGEKAGEVFKMLKAQDRAVLKDGDAKFNKDGSPTLGYPGMLYVQANNKMAPLILDASKAPLRADSGRPYSGCQVNAKIEIWAQDSHQWGRRLNCALLGVQFVRDGERLGGGSVASEDDFEPIEGVEEAGAMFGDADPFG